MREWLRCQWCLWVHGDQWCPVRESRTGISLEVRCAECGRRYLFHRQEGFAIPWTPRCERFFQECGE